MGELQIGMYTVPVILTVALGIIYHVAGESLPNRAKPVLAIAIGVGLGMLALVRAGLPWDMVNVIDHGLYGFMSGAAAVGLYEIQRAVRRPRE